MQKQWNKEKDDVFSYYEEDYLNAKLCCKGEDGVNIESDTLEDTFAKYFDDNKTDCSEQEDEQEPVDYGSDRFDPWTEEELNNLPCKPTNWA